jgi:hypothetical protein
MPAIMLSLTAEKRTWSSTVPSRILRKENVPFIGWDLRATRSRVRKKYLVRS